MTATLVVAVDGVVAVVVEAVVVAVSGVLLATSERNGQTVQKVQTP